MLSKSDHPSHQITVNLHCRFMDDQRSTNIWKMQTAPANDIRIGQRIWFESEIFAMRKSVEGDLGGGHTIRVK